MAVAYAAARGSRFALGRLSAFRALLCWHLRRARDRRVRRASRPVGRGGVGRPARDRRLGPRPGAHRAWRRRGRTRSTRGPRRSGVARGQHEPDRARDARHAAARRGPAAGGARAACTRMRAGSSAGARTPIRIPRVALARRARPPAARRGQRGARARGRGAAARARVRRRRSEWGWRCGRSRVVEGGPAGLALLDEAVPRARGGGRAARARSRHRGSGCAAASLRAAQGRDRGTARGHGTRRPLRRHDARRVRGRRAAARRRAPAADRDARRAGRSRRASIASRTSPRRG